MTYDVAAEGAPWFEHLTDSVDALGEAAREWQLAHQGAALFHALSDRPTGHLHEGRVTCRPSSEEGGWDARPFARSPHADASFELRRVYMDAAHRTRAEYESAALAYASGAAWAVRAVRAGEQPPRVVQTVEGPDRIAVVGDLAADVSAFRAEHYGQANRVEEACDRLLECLAAGHHAEEIGRQDYVSERDDAEAAECSAVAEGTADAAYAYGRILRAALGFVLLDPRAAHRKQLAAASAAEAAQSAGAAQ